MLPLCLLGWTGSCRLVSLCLRLSPFISARTGSLCLFLVVALHSVPLAGWTGSGRLDSLCLPLSSFISAPNPVLQALFSWCFKLVSLCLLLSPFISASNSVLQAAALSPSACLLLSLFPMWTGSCSLASLCLPWLGLVGQVLPLCLRLPPLSCLLQARFIWCFRLGSVERVPLCLPSYLLQNLCFTGLRSPFVSAPNSAASGCIYLSSRMCPCLCPSPSAADRACQRPVKSMGRIYTSTCLLLSLGFVK